MVFSCLKPYPSQAMNLGLSAKGTWKITLQVEQLDPFSVFVVVNILSSYQATRLPNPGPLFWTNSSDL